MADILNFYTDIDMKDIALSPPVGVASIVKTDDPTKPDLTKISNWDEIGQFTGTEKIYRKNINAQSGIGLGGTSAIATLFSPENWVTGDTPKTIDGDVRNAFFINCVNMSSGDTPNYRGYVFYINGRQWYETQNHKWMFGPYVMLGTYRADPTNEVTTKAERTSHWYYTAGDYEVHAEVSSAGWDSNSQFNQIAMYSCVIEEKDYFLFVLGVNNGALHPSNDTACMLIPRSYFKYNIPKPYVGPVTPESAAGFTPPGRELYNDSIKIRDIENTNPFGFNNKIVDLNSVNLIIQTATQYRYFVYGLYHGKDLVSGMGTLAGAAGFAQRPQEQVEIMSQGVLSCKMMPFFEMTGLGQCMDDSICGYQIGSPPIWSGINGLGIYINQIAKINKSCGYISRTYNNFLDFEPYTSMTLHIPFLGDVAIDPSVLYGAELSLQGYIDYFTGLLSLSIVVEKNNVSYIYTTLQGNCAVDVPIVGAGSSSTQAIGKIASGLGKMASNPVNGVFGILQGLNQVGKSIPITQNTESSLAAMFSPRSIYLTINTPLPENPSNYAALMGTVVRKEGTVGRYTGYSEFSAVNLNTVVATDAEKEEIERLLRTGVFV